MIQDVTQEWFNDFYASSSGELRRLGRSLQEAENVTGVFDFQSQEYIDRRLTVLFDVQLEYRGDPDDALMILQKPWRQLDSIGAYRQLLVASQPVFFENVEVTAPPTIRTASSPIQEKKEALSTGAIVGIIVIFLAVVVLVGVVFKIRYGAKSRNRVDAPAIKSTPYQAHVNEEENSVLFPQTESKKPADASTMGGISMPSSKDDQSYDGKR
jgi:hypothetical protein